MRSSRLSLLVQNLADRQRWKTSQEFIKASLNRPAPDPFGVRFISY